MTADQDLAAGVSDRSQLSVAQILDLCDERLGEVGKRRHVFGWLRASGAGPTDWIPVDGYYQAKHIVVVCRDQPYENARLFQEQVPRHGLRLLELEPARLGGDREQATDSLDQLISAVAPGALVSRPSPPRLGPASPPVLARSPPTPGGHGSVPLLVPSFRPSLLHASAPAVPLAAPPPARRALPPPGPRASASPFGREARLDQGRLARAWAALALAPAPVTAPVPGVLPAPGAPMVPGALPAPSAVPVGLQVPVPVPVRRVGQSEPAAALRGARFVAEHETRTIRARPRVPAPHRPAPPPPPPQAEPSTFEDQSLRVLAALGLAAVIFIEVYFGVVQLGVDGNRPLLGFGLALDAGARALGSLVAERRGAPGWILGCVTGGSPVVAGYTLLRSGGPLETEPAPLAGMIALLAVFMIVIGLIAAALAV